MAVLDTGAPSTRRRTTEINRAFLTSRLLPEQADLTCRAGWANRQHDGKMRFHLRHRPLHRHPPTDEGTVPQAPLHSSPQPQSHQKPPSRSQSPQQSPNRLLGETSGSLPLPRSPTSQSHIPPLQNSLLGEAAGSQQHPLPLPPQAQPPQAQLQQQTATAVANATSATATTYTSTVAAEWATW